MTLSDEYNQKQSSKLFNGSEWFCFEFHIYLSIIKVHLSIIKVYLTIIKVYLFIIKVHLSR